jgi:hypothetical protein
LPVQKSSSASTTPILTLPPKSPCIELNSKENNVQKTISDAMLK